jgi:hypothetical protein
MDFDLFATNLTDFDHLRRAIYSIVCLTKDWSIPDLGGDMVADVALRDAMNNIYFCLLRQTAAMIEQHWPAIVRVAKHLERRGVINDPAMLDDLIERGGRRATK